MDIRSIYERWKAITPIPWEREKTRYGYMISAPNGDPLLKYASWDGFIEVHGSEDNPDWGRITARANAEFIVHAPGDIADLMTEVRRLSDENAALRAEVAQLQSRETSIANATKRERAAVVAWLRDVAETMNHNGDKCCGRVEDLADAVARGEHRREEEE